MFCAVGGAGVTPYQLFLPIILNCGGNEVARGFARLMDQE